MELTKQEQHILATKRFFNEFQKKFPDVRMIGVVTSTIISSLQNIEKSYSLQVKVNHQKLGWFTYTWELDFPLELIPCNKSNSLEKTDASNGQTWEYDQVKDFIRNIFPEPFNDKDFYDSDIIANTLNIEKLLVPVNLKLNAISLANKLNKELIENPEIKVKRIKI